MGRSFLTEFEYDIKKSLSNKEKHGIDFEEAKLLWNDKNALVIPANIIENESRYAIISKIKENFYIAIFTIRNEKYRIISVRNCRKKEVQMYERNII